MKRFALIFLVLVPAKAWGVLKVGCSSDKPTVSLEHQSKQFEQKSFQIIQEKLLNTPTMCLLETRASDMKLEQFKKTDLIPTRLKKLLPTITWNSEYLTDDSIAMINNIIQTEAQHPGYESFAHGANGNLVILLELQKKLYAIFHNNGIMPTYHEFLRARKGRAHLIGVTSKEYTKKCIWDSHDQYRTDLLAVGYFVGNNIPEENPFYFYFHNWSVYNNWYQKITEILDSYNLPIPTHIELPCISHGVLLHIIIKKEVADRIVYNSKAYGVPAHSIELLSQKDSHRFEGQARIILDPTVFDQPNDVLKIYRYQQLTDQEKKDIDKFCDELIAKAQELKKQQELEKQNFEYFKTHIMTTE